MSTFYTPMANGRDQTVMDVGKFYGTYVVTANDRIGTFASSTWPRLGRRRLPGLLRFLS